MEKVKLLLEKLGFKDVQRFFDEKGTVDIETEVKEYNADREAVMREKLKPEIASAAKIAGEIGVFERLRKNMQPALEKLGKKLSDFPEEKQDLNALEFLLAAATKEPQKAATGDIDEAVKKANEKWQAQLIEKNQQIEALQAEVATMPTKLSEVETKFERDAAVRSLISGFKLARTIDDSDVFALVQNKLAADGIQLVKENGKFVPKNADGTIPSKTDRELYSFETLIEAQTEPYFVKSNDGNDFRDRQKRYDNVPVAPLLNGKEIEIPEHLKEWSESE